MIGRLLYAIVFLFASANAFAEFEFPPKVQTEDAVRARVRTLRTQIPEIVTSPNFSLELWGKRGDDSVNNHLLKEQSLVAKLKKDKAFMALAAKRPPLRTWSFERLGHRRGEKQAGRNEQWRAFSVEAGAIASRSFKNDNDDEDPETLAGKVAVLPKTILQPSSQALFSALAQFIPSQGRSHLAIPDLKERWRQIRPLLESHPIATLREKFQIGKFGVRRTAWTLQDLDDLVLEIDANEMKVAVLIEAFVQAKTHDKKNTSFYRWQEWLFNSADTPDKLIARQINHDAAGMAAIAVLKKRMERLFRTTDAATAESETYVQRRLILREIPAYLAVFRGCVGDDCATTNSPFIPYTPYERYWWIEDAIGQRLGYVSGLITQVKERPNLYIRDITGRGIQNDDVELILNGFYLVKNELGVDQMTRMTNQFAGQNHFKGLYDALRNYGDGETVSQEFLDNWIREKYLGNGGDYDAQTDHNKAIAVRPPQATLKRFQVQDVTGHSRPNDFRNNPDLLWQTLSVSAQLNEWRILHDSFPDENVAWKTLLQVLRNPRKLKLKDYYKSIEAEFKNRELPYSQNLLKKHELATRHGHLAAPDAFGIEGERQSVRHLIEIIWRSHKPDTGAAFVRKHLDLLEGNEIFLRQVHTLFERREEKDRGRVRLLWQAGFRFKNMPYLRKADWQWLIEQLPEEEHLESAILILQQPAFADIRSFDDVFMEMQTVFAQEPTAAFFKQIEPVLMKLIKLDRWEGLGEGFWRALFENRGLFGRLDLQSQFLTAVYFLRSSEVDSAIHSPLIAKAYQIVVENLDQPFVGPKLRRQFVERISIYAHEYSQYHKRYQRKVKGELPEGYLTRKCVHLLENAH